MNRISRLEASLRTTNTRFVEMLESSTMLITEHHRSISNNERYRERDEMPINQISGLETTNNRFSELERSNTELKSCNEEIEKSIKDLKKEMRKVNDIAVARLTCIFLSRAYSSHFLRGVSNC